MSDSVAAISNLPPMIAAIICLDAADGSAFAVVRPLKRPDFLVDIKSIGTIAVDVNAKRVYRPLTPFSQ
jgi:hypothetical protein